MVTVGALWKFIMYNLQVNKYDRNSELLFKPRFKIFILKKMFERAILFYTSITPNIRKESGISENRHFTKEIQYHIWQIFCDTTAQLGEHWEKTSIDCTTLGWEKRVNTKKGKQRNKQGSCYQWKEKKTANRVKWVPFGWTHIIFPSSSLFWGPIHIECHFNSSSVDKEETKYLWKKQLM
jgi:hypothetical protein